MMNLHSAYSTPRPVLSRALEMSFRLFAVFFNQTHSANRPVTWHRCIFLKIFCPVGADVGEGRDYIRKRAQLLTYHGVDRHGVWFKWTLFALTMRCVFMSSGTNFMKWVLERRDWLHVTGAPMCACEIAVNYILLGFQQTPPSIRPSTHHSSHFQQTIQGS